jgi:hypothetical protein
MKKLILYILALMMIGAGCKKTYNDTVQGQTPDQRISAALAAYQKKLTSAPYGWIFMESTTGTAYNQGVSQTGPKIVLAYYMSFTDSGRVTMLSDFDPTMAATTKTSSYQVKELTRPALIFDTYSYLHVPCDPDPKISHSPYGFGYGWGTDFEFSFSDSTTSLGDTIHLLGNLNSAQGTLIKATQQQQSAYLAGNVLPLMTGANHLNNILEYFKRLSFGGVSYDLRFDPVNRTVTFTWVDGSGKIQTSTANYYVTGAGILFTTPIVNGNQKITGFDNLSWNAATSTLTVSIGGQSGTVVGAPSPVKADVAAPARWWNYGVSNGYFWASWSGFHVNGVDDAYGVTKLSNSSGTFYYYAYRPNYFTGSGDLFLPIMLINNSLNYNAYGSEAANPLFVSSDGRAIFNNAGDVGINGATVPPGGPVAKTDSTLYISAGFYFVQTGPKSYDMVLATDARTWLSWFWPL